MHRSCGITLHAIWLLTFIVASTALQNKPTQGEWLLTQSKEMANTTGDSDAWSVLSSYYQTQCYETWCGLWETCSSTQYQQYYQALPALQMQELRLPPNVRILFYGHSYMLQLLDTVLVANRKFFTLWGSRSHEDFLPKEEDGHGCHAVKWESEINTTIINIINCEPLQRVRNVAYLEDFLHKHGPHDIAFFMNPHRDCYWANECTAEEMEDLDFVSDRSDVDSLWTAVKSAVTGDTYEVEAWSDKGRSAFHADERFVIRTSETLKGRACNVDDHCTAGFLSGHQCQPGLLAVSSKSIVDAINQKFL